MEKGEWRREGSKNGRRREKEEKRKKKKENKLRIYGQKKN